MSRPSVRGTLAGALVGLLLLLLAIGAAGAGHGTYLPAKLLFPFAMLAARFGDAITWPYVILALAQFPLYGLLLGSVFHSHRFRLCIAALVALHCVVAALVLTSPDSFTVVPCQRPNPAMQLTASKLVVHASGVCHQRFLLRGEFLGLAAADLVSR